MGDTIDLLLANNGIASKHLAIISNYLVFDEEGCIKDFPKPLITTGKHFIKQSCLKQGSYSRECP